MALTGELAVYLLIFSSIGWKQALVSSTVTLATQGGNQVKSILKKPQTLGLNVSNQEHHAFQRRERKHLGIFEK